MRIDIKNGDDENSQSQVDEARFDHIVCTLRRYTNAQQDMFAEHLADMETAHLCNLEDKLIELDIKYAKQIAKIYQ